jgi:hypothetical protein
MMGQPCEFQVNGAAERVAVTGGWTLRVEGLEATLCF